MIYSNENAVMHFCSKGSHYVLPKADHSILNLWSDCLYAAVSQLPAVLVPALASEGINDKLRKRSGPE